MHELQADVLVVGGGTGGTAAALQSARRGAKTILVNEFPWLGGMLTSAGVAAPDGNELAAFQTGIWGAFLQELQKRQPGGLNHGWVSFFTYHPDIGAQIFADWVAALPNLEWIAGQVPLEVLQQGNRITGVRFANLTVRAQITLDGTELGDLLALAEVPYRWGWELQTEWNEPSAPIAPIPLMQQYPIQAPTWVVMMQDFGAGAAAAAIPAPPNYSPDQFSGAWEKYGPEKFLNYGRLPANRFMINWPIRGNDYGERICRLVESDSARQEFLQEARWHAQGFAHFIQTQLGRRYGLANDSFPLAPSTQYSASTPHSTAYALHPYYRESRRLQGMVTLREQDILPISGGYVAPLPIHISAQGCTQVESVCDAIAIGNYANDHHYPSGDISLKAKSMQWGGRWTGTPFTIPYRCLVPKTTDGLLVCEKNISVSHIANGATRLQPLVLGIGQAAGMAAALCVEQGCEPRDLAVRSLQTALINDEIAPAAVIPLFDLLPQHPDWRHWQSYYLDHPEAYPGSGNCPLKIAPQNISQNMSEAVLLGTPQQSTTSSDAQVVSGAFRCEGQQTYKILLAEPESLSGQLFSLVTLQPQINEQLATIAQNQTITVIGSLNTAGNWLLANEILLQASIT
jgi:hypothetical protein